MAATAAVVMAVAQKAEVAPAAAVRVAAPAWMAVAATVVAAARAVAAVRTVGSSSLPSLYSSGDRCSPMNLTHTPAVSSQTPDGSRHALRKILMGHYGP